MAVSWGQASERSRERPVRSKPETTSSDDHYLKRELYDEFLKDTKLLEFL
jgi:hypothetical protein